MSMCLTLLSLYLLLLLSINIFAAAATDSEPMESNMKECKKRGKSFDFEEGWPLLQTAVDTLINQFDEEESVHNNKSIFTSDQYMDYYKYPSPHYIHCLTLLFPPCFNIIIMNCFLLSNNLFPTLVIHLCKTKNFEKKKKAGKSFKETWTI